MIDFSRHRSIGTLSIDIDQQQQPWTYRRLVIFPRQYAYRRVTISLFSPNNTKVYTTNRNRHAQN
jgi:hypothetical protein